MAELTEPGKQEKDSQAECEQLMTDIADKRAYHSKSLTEKGAAMADVDASLQIHSRSGLAASEVFAVLKHLAKQQRSAALAQLASRIPALLRCGSAGGD